MRLSEALALCPQLALLPPDPVAVEEATELLYARLEDLGLPLEPAGPGPRAARHRSRRAALRRPRRGADAAAGTPRPAPASAPLPGRFPALAATRRARTGRPVSVTPPAVREFLAPLAIESLVEDGEVDPALVEALRRLGIDRLGRLEAIGRLQVRDRFGPAGEHAWRLASGDDRDAAQAAPRPRADARDAGAARRGRHRGHARPRAARAGRAAARAARPARPASRARCGSAPGWWAAARGARRPPLREPTADAARIRLALQAKLRELPAPAEELTVEIAGLAPGNRQVPLFREDGEARAARLASAVGQVRAALGESAALHVVAVDEASRLPERRFGLAPR